MALTEEEFKVLARQGYNRIPMAREVLADLDTPLSAYLKLADGRFSFLLESVQGGEQWGRYSIIGLPAVTVIYVHDHEVTVEVSGEVIQCYEAEDPLEAIREFQERYKVAEVPGLPKFSGGLVGYFGYDVISYIEPRINTVDKHDPIGSPDILLMVSEELVVFDNLSGRLHLVVHVDPGENSAYQRGMDRLDHLVDRLSGQSPRPRPPESRRSIAESDFKPSFEKKAFLEAVEKCKEYIRAGDIFQIVLSQRLSVPFFASGLDLYRALRTLNPSPYMMLMNFGDFHVVGSSPEILVRLEDDVVTVRPIAGTRPRGATAEEDKKNERELISDAKELAEHLMLVDLGRNDVGRIAEVGSVRLTSRMDVEYYSHVMHIVSNVIGQIRPGYHALDVIRATFPAGTVSGAPKVRAMEIIEEFESIKRGIYSGAIGYIGWNGNMDTCIAIRTAVIADDELYVQAGAGIVADSVPEAEWEETINKARAVFQAVAMASKGLDTEANVTGNTERPRIRTGRSQQSED